MKDELCNKVESQLVELSRMSQAIYLACDEEVAIDVSTKTRNAIKLIRELSDIIMNKWIKVKDEYPKPGTWVLASSTGMTWILFYDGMTKDGHHNWLDDGDWSEDVSHWMPLPKFNEQNQLEINPYNLIEEQKED